MKKTPIQMKTQASNCLLRREATKYIFSIGLSVAGFSARGATNADSLLFDFKKELKNFTDNPNLVEKMRSQREFSEYFPDQKLERAPSKSKPSTLKISQDAINLIFECEISSEAVYKKKYEGPVWPGGRSGVTIGIGYDLGYATPTEFQASWIQYLEDRVILETLGAVCEITGQAANDAVQVLRKTKSIKLPYEIASKQFLGDQLPRYIGLTQQSLPNFSLLSPDCRGALVSLVYNRGASFLVPSSKDPTGRFEQMRAIRNLMITKNFSNIPDQIRGMISIWENDPDMRGVVIRRRAEAKLFELGLVRS